MDKEAKKILRNNTIKLIIGLILLSLSAGYLHNHPAERASVRSGFEIMYQRAEVFVHKIFGENSELLNQKYNYEKYYKELLKMAENKSCIDPTIIKELNEKYTNLQKEPTSTLKETLPDYTRFIHKVDKIVKKGCE